MNSFEFYSPTKVIFGRDAEQRVGEELKSLGADRVLIVFGGGSVKKSGLLARVEKQLEQSGIYFAELGGVCPNPRLGLVREGIELCRRDRINLLLAIGGGSTIDTAKAISIGVPYEGDVWDFYSRKAVPQKALPTANILTIAAAGSETSMSSVITKEEGLEKRGCKSDLIRPRVTFMNPELLYTLSPYQTACGITDIMMHTFERYFTTSGENEMTDRIAEALLKTVMQYGLECMKDPFNYEARSEVMWAGSLSHNQLTGLGRSQDWATHQLEHELGGMFDVAHGAGLAAVWGSWARYVYKNDVMRFARYGVNVLGLNMDYDHPAQTALRAIEATEEYFVKIGMPISLPQLMGRELTEEEIKELSVKCTFYGERTIGGMMTLGEAEISDIYHMANK